MVGRPTRRRGWLSLAEVQTGLDLLDASTVLQFEIVSGGLTTPQGQASIELTQHFESLTILDSLSTDLEWAVRSDPANGHSEPASPWM